jgi:hypothetical protein
MFAEALSWVMAGGLGPCLVKPEHSQQSANNNEHQDCPTFFAGTLLTFERGADILKRDDNDKAVVAGFTIVLAISTIGLWLATNRLWEAGERQLSHLSNTAERQLRAYIAVSEVKILYADGEWQPNIRVTYQNYGQTPAYEVENGIGYFFQIAGTPSFKDLRQKDTRTMYLAPSQDRTTSAIVTQAQWNLFKDAVARKGVAFFVYGEIHYTDVFGEPRWTRYRLQLDPDDEGIKEDSFVLCAEGNEAN